MLFILLFAFLCWQGTGIVADSLKDSEYLHEQDILTFWNSFYSNVMVFTARILVRWYQIGVYSRLATIESILGWLLFTLFLVTLAWIMIH